MRLSGRLPEDHGLATLAARMCADPLTPRYAVVELDCTSIQTDTVTGEQSPTLRIRRIEGLVDTVTAAHLQGMLGAAQDVRLGVTALWDETRTERPQ